MFNNGKPYHGSDNVMNGKLHGSSGETDYFFCPNCPDQHLLRVLDYTIHAEEPEHAYKKHVTKHVSGTFIVTFQVYCEHCKLDDFVKTSSIGWQGGNYADIMRRTANL